jgi:hypothetical protein
MNDEYMIATDDEDFNDPLYEDEDEYDDEDYEDEDYPLYPDDEDVSN